MKLPGAASAIVPEDKIRKYLLSASHVEGRFKARFFKALGYTDENWQQLASALKQHALDNEAVLSKENIYGMFYNVDGPLVTPDGRSVALRSAWLITIGASNPKLITAHPLNL